MRISDSLVLDLLRDSHKVNAEQLKALQDQEALKEKLSRTLSCKTTP